MKSRLSVFVLFLTLIALCTPVILAAQKEITFLNIPPNAAFSNYIKTVIIPEFEAKFNVKVNMVDITWNNRMDKITVLRVAGTPADVIVTGYYTPYEETSQGLIEPLDKYVAKWDNYKKYPEPLMDALRWNGHLMVIPNNIDFRIMAYNKELFAQSGYDPERPPQSWDEQYQYVKRLTRLEGDKVSIRGFQIRGIGSQPYSWFLRQTGLTEFDQATFKSNLDKPAALEALLHLLSLYDATHVTMPNLGNYSQGCSAIWEAGTSVSKTLKETNPDLIPVIGAFSPRRYPNSKPVAQAFINGLAITSDSREKDLAWEFIALMNSDKHIVKLQELGGFIAGRVDLVRKMMELQPRIELWYEQFPYLEAFVIPPPRNTSQVELDNLLQKAFKLQLSPQAALLQGHELYQRLLDEWKPIATKGSMK